MDDFSRIYEAGLTAEREIVQYLSMTGHEVRASTPGENIYQDIDTYISIDGVMEPVSIKSQARGIFFQNYTMELETERRTPYADAGQWNESWYHYGNATYYLILHDLDYVQPWQMPTDRVTIERFRHWQPRYHLLRKEDIQAYVEQWGWLRVAGLNEATLARQGGYNTRNGILSMRSLRDITRLVPLPRNWRQVVNSVVA